MITEFSGTYAFLSNFHPSPLMFEGYPYNTVEHAFQAAKTDDPAEREAIRNAPTPGIAKRLGRKVNLRDDWEAVKDEVMYDLVYRKFAINPELKQKLLDTGTQELIEGNDWGDREWGVYRGFGKNKLGKTLMRVRDELRA